MQAIALALVAVEHAGKLRTLKLSESLRAETFAYGAIITIILLPVISWIAAGAKLRKPSLLKLSKGADGRASTSKAQWLAWLTVIFYGYLVLTWLRWRAGAPLVITNVPVNLLTVLGFSTGTAVSAKAITGSYVRAGKTAKAAAGTTGAKGGLLSDDSGVPDVGKVQMVAFTVLAIAIYLVNLWRSTSPGHFTGAMPDIDSSLLVLMGISQGGYVGKKLVTYGSPVLYQAVRDRAVGAGPHTAKVTGHFLTANGAPGTLLIDGQARPDREWRAGQITFEDPEPGSQLEVQVSVGGQLSNTVTLEPLP